MLTSLLKPKTDFAALFLRLGLACIFIVHGIFKIDQDFPLLEDTMSLNTQIALGWVELICGGLLLVGLFSRLAALALIPTQIAAIVLVTGRRALLGPSIKATGADYTKVGPEFNLVLILMCLAVIVLGSGVISLDHLLLTGLRKKKGAASAAPVAQGAHV
jgi:putative oxidoreductase